MTRRPLELDVLFSESWKDFTDNLRGYVLIELWRVSMFVLALIGIWLVASGVAVLFGLGAFGLAAGVLAVVFSIDERLAEPIVMLMAIVGQLGVYASVLLVWAGVTVAAAGVFVPVQLSVYRAVARADRRPLAVSAVWTGVLRAVPTTLVIVGVLVALLVGSQFTLLVPLVLAVLFLGFVLPAVAIHDCGAVAALEHNLHAFRREPGPFLLLGLLAAGVTLASANVPVLGGAYALAFRMRAARFLLVSSDAVDGSAGATEARPRVS